MKLLRKAILPAMAVAAMMLATPASALAATSTDTARAATSVASVVTPNAYHYILVATHIPTHQQCASLGDEYVFDKNSTYRFSCVEFSDGALLYYNLYIGVPE